MIKMKYNNEYTDMKHQCNHCAKEYTNKTAYTRHELLCSLLLQNDRSRKIENEEQKGQPSHSELVIMVQELAVKYTILEEKLDKIQSESIQHKKQKIDVVVWLNQNILPPYPFEELSERLIVMPQHIDTLFVSKFLPIIDTIFQECLVKSNCPIYCVKNKIYKYTKSGEWSEIEKKRIGKIIKQGKSKILG